MKTKTITVSVLFFCVCVAANLCKAQQTKDSITRLPCINKTFSIMVHIVKDTSKQGDNYGLFGYQSPAVIQAAIQKSIDSLNAHFAPICVSFQVCNFQSTQPADNYYIPNYFYLNLAANYVQKSKEMMVLYNSLNRINLYYVESIGANPYYDLDSITDPIKGGIVLDNYTTFKYTLQAMAQYFGLATTYNIPGELVNGSNSSTTGDLITDTPADSYVAGGSLASYVDGNCKFISMQKDANGQYYSPIVGNGMSPYLCLCNSPYAFTRDQYIKMAKTYLSNPGMW